MYENQKEEILNPSDTIKPKSNTIPIILITSVALVVIAIFSITFIIQYNNKKQEILRAEDKVETLCSQLDDINEISDSMQYQKLQEKLNEAKKLAKEYGISEKFKTKLDDLETYIGDLNKLYSINHMNHSENLWTNLIKEHDLINSITNDKVLAKLDEEMNLKFYEMMANEKVITNSLKKAVRDLESKYPDFDIESVFYISPDTDTSTMGFTYGYSSRNLNVIGYDKEQIDSNYSYEGEQPYITTNVPVKTLDKIEADGGYAMVAQGTKIQEGKKGGCSYWYNRGYEVKANYNNHKITYDVYEYHDGKEPIITRGLSAKAVYNAGGDYKTGVE